jgi:teichuronic acid biosynthesis glycosyltransferase TuaH
LNQNLELPGLNKSKIKILFISNIDWYLTKQRPQHIAEGLSRFFQVTYFCRRSWSTEKITMHDSTDERNAGSILINKNLRIIRHRTLPGGRFSIISYILNKYYKHYFRRLLNSIAFDLIWITSPFQLLMLPDRNDEVVCFDYMDNYVEFVNDKKKKKLYSVLEKKLLQISALQFASGTKLFMQLKERGATQLSLVRNAVDWSVFDYGKEFLAAGQKKKATKVVGYFGAVAEWFDVDLLIRISDENPLVSFIIIGPIYNRNIKECVRDRDNISLLGPIAFKQIRNFLADFDVCLYPFIRNSITDFVNPVKIYEYLSFGKPVVSTVTSETPLFEELIYLAKDHTDFCNKLRIALSEDDPEKRTKRIDFASENTWEHRVLDISQLIVKKLEK